MKMNNWFLRSAAAASIAAMTVISSCKDEVKRFNAEDAQALSEEAIADAYYEDADDVSSSVVYDTENATNNGRVATDIVSNDGRLKDCATITLTGDKTSGVITIDFGDGCTYRGNTREGKIILTYSNGPAGSNGFTVVTTFEAYKINDIELKGKRTIVKEANATQTNLQHHIVLEDGQAIWPDGSTILRESDFTRIWVRDETDPRILLDGSASGKTRLDKTYTMEINETLVYRRECMVDEGIFMAVQGEKVFNTDGKQIVIDYGTGACDRTVTITVNGISRQVSVANN
ncbi:hypothetical protein [Pseudochryseolinea flava]|uniref:Lipoprotein n=1 Tax=Pseudochryseolinea flava TaxID=2059302 RepID=A0A364XV00_9BACT|nr:hypothetical protein [Pseudochryseolinea flava]RAV97951.1 hypothetical protein DQQ10_26125 [Pseudochryseolinea flava]